MDRRKFLGLFAASSTAYFLPPVGGWKSNLIVNPFEHILGGHMVLQCGDIVVRTPRSGELAVWRPGYRGLLRLLKRGEYLMDGDTITLL